MVRRWTSVHKKPFGHGKSENGQVYRSSHLGVEWSKPAGQVYMSLHMDAKWPDEVDKPHGHGMTSKDGEKVA